MLPSQDTYGHPVIPVPSERTSISRCMDKQSEVTLPSQDEYVARIDNVWTTVTIIGLNSQRW